MSLQLLYFAFDLAQPLFLSFLDQTFKMTLLHQFSMDWLGTWTVGSHICSLSTCTTRLYNITLFQVHFWHPQGTFQDQIALLAVIWYRLFQHFGCTCYWIIFMCLKLIVHLRWQSDLWQLLQLGVTAHINSYLALCGELGLTPPQ